MDVLTLCTHRHHLENTKFRQICYTPNESMVRVLMLVFENIHEDMKRTRDLVIGQTSRNDQYKQERIDLKKSQRKETTKKGQKGKKGKKQKQPPANGKSTTFKAHRRKHMPRALAETAAKKVSNGTCTWSLTLSNI